MRHFLTRVCVDLVNIELMTKKHIHSRSQSSNNRRNKWDCEWIAPAAIALRTSSHNGIWLSRFEFLNDKLICNSNVGRGREPRGVHEWCRLYLPLSFMQIIFCQLIEAIVWGNFNKLSYSSGVQEKPLHLWSSPQVCRIFRGSENLSTCPDSLSQQKSPWNVRKHLFTLS